MSYAGALSGLALSKVKADCSDRAALLELVLSTPSFRNLWERSRTVRLPAIRSVDLSMLN